MYTCLKHNKVKLNFAKQNAIRVTTYFTAFMVFGGLGFLFEVLFGFVCVFFVVFFLNISFH